MVAILDPPRLDLERPTPGEYELDVTRCIIEFSVRHLLVATVRGRIAPLSGELVVDDGDPLTSWVRVDLDAHGASTAQRERDGVLASARLLDADRHPVIRFESTAVEGRHDGSVSIWGDLYVAGSVVELPLHARIVGCTQGSVRFSASGVLSRRAVGLGWGELERGGVVIADPIRLMMAAEFARKEGGR